MYVAASGHVRVVLDASHGIIWASGSIKIGSNTINTAAYRATSYFATAGHNHSGTYAPASHTHDYLADDHQASNITSTHITVLGNTSGNNTGDQTLPTDFVSKANGGTFSGNVTIGSTSTNKNLTVHGNINGGTLSGNNSGDQTLPTRDSLSIDTNDTVTFAGLRVTGTGVGALQVDKLEPYSNGSSEFHGPPGWGANRYTTGQCGGTGVTAGNPTFEFGYFKLIYGLIQPYSDERLKMDIKPTSIGLDFLRALTINTFKMRDSKTPRTKVGFIAQEIEAALESAGIEDPSFINVPEYDKNPDFFKAVDITQVLSVCINAIKQLDAKVQDLEAKLDEK
jgi:hypothetical protein